jgi:hypothetical protein
MDSKKLLVISDTHGGVTALKAVFNWAKERTPPNDSICAAVFLGDGLIDLQSSADETGFLCNWAKVKGNNDYGFQEADTALFDFVNYRFFICHGHHYSLYGGYHPLVSAARYNGANVVLFGHSHIPCHKTLNGTILINPGSVGHPRSNKGRTFAVIECAEEQQLKAEFYRIDDKGQIKKIKI